MSRYGPATSWRFPPKASPKNLGREGGRPAEETPPCRGTNYTFEDAVSHMQKIFSD